MNEIAKLEAEVNDDSIQKDFEFSRAHIITVVEVADKAITELSDVAEQAQTNARLYEVLANLLNTKLAATKDLLTLHKTKAEQVVEDNTTKIGTQQNFLFNGSTAELQELLKKNKVIDHE